MDEIIAKLEMLIVKRWYKIILFVISLFQSCVFSFHLIPTSLSYKASNAEI